MLNLFSSKTLFVGLFHVVIVVSLVGQFITNGRPLSDSERLLEL